mmetsp:Transcript_28567/g.53092  ORF Transcript_28567/g.53092 Transcript_28567/m.53092 type:complete len:209 (+) Transcript_28567:1074-1700(+)
MQKYPEPPPTPPLRWCRSMRLSCIPPYPRSFLRSSSSRRTFSGSVCPISVSNRATSLGVRRFLSPPPRPAASSARPRRPASFSRPRPSAPPRGRNGLSSPSGSAAGDEISSPSLPAWCPPGLPHRVCSRTSWSTREDSSRSLPSRPRRRRPRSSTLAAPPPPSPIPAPALRRNSRSHPGSRRCRSPPDRRRCSRTRREKPLRCCRPWA